MIPLYRDFVFRNVLETLLHVWDVFADGCAFRKEATENAFRLLWVIVNSQGAGIS